MSARSTGFVDPTIVSLFCFYPCFSERSQKYLIDGQRRAAQQTMSGGEWLGAARTSTNWRCCRCAEARGGEGGEACMRECVYVFFSLI